MTGRIVSTNDLVSLSVMLLMIIALVAAQANATEYRTAVAATAATAATEYEETVLPPNARLAPRFDAATLTLSIDAPAEIRQSLLDVK